MAGLKKRLALKCEAKKRQALKHRFWNSELMNAIPTRNYRDHCYCREILDRFHFRPSNENQTKRLKWGLGAAKGSLSPLLHIGSPDEDQLTKLTRESPINTKANMLSLLIWWLPVGSRSREFDCCEFQTKKKPFDRRLQSFCIDPFLLK